jgi:hypothetical protein
MCGREVGPPDVIGMREIRPPVARSIEARIERHVLAEDVSPLQSGADRGPRNLILRCLFRQEFTRVSVRLPLAVVLLRQLELVVLVQLVGELHGGIVESREIFDLFAGLLGDEPGNEQPGVVVAIGRVEPQLAAHDRSA